MIKDSVFFEQWEKNFRRSEDLDLERKFRLYQGMFDEALAPGILPGRNPCAGLETKIRLARAIHVQAASGETGSSA